jgi:hypothetical protein
MGAGAISLFAFPYPFANAASVGAPLRDTPKPGLRQEPVAAIENDAYRAEFFEATWDGGKAYVRDMYRRVGEGWDRLNDESERFDEQWVVLQGATGDPNDYYGAMESRWVAFTELRRVDDKTVELKGTDPDSYDLTVRWSLRDALPWLDYTLVPGRDANYVVGYQSFAGSTLDEVNEVLCGPKRHARVTGGVESLSNWELTFPGSLVERDASGEPFTFGVLVPADRVPFIHEPATGYTNHFYGMSLRDNDGAIRPVAYAPQYGDRSKMTAGRPYEFGFLLCAKPVVLYDAYRDIVREQYGYEDYRQNVFGRSLTDTMYELIDLIMVEPEGDDSVEYVRSYSGWWNRAKGFVDIENIEAVRTTSTSVLLEAYYLRGEDEVYERRARPTIEYHVSRNYYGWTLVKGRKVYGDPTKYKLGSVPFDISTLGPLYTMTCGNNPAIKELALRKFASGDDFWLKRTPINSPLAAYRMTGDREYLEQAEEEARRYIAEEIATPYTHNGTDEDFQYYYSKGWTELLELYEETGKREYLDAAYTEAKRFVTQHFVRPVPDGGSPPLKVPDLGPSPRTGTGTPGGASIPGRRYPPRRRRRG